MHQKENKRGIGKYEINYYLGQQYLEMMLTGLCKRKHDGTWTYFAADMAYHQLIKFLESLMF